MLSEYGVTTIELGVQSMDDEVLKCSSRGHTAQQVREAAELIRRYPIRLGLQMMTHLPGDTDEKSIMTAEQIIGLKPDMVRIYPTLVIKDTYLEKMYERGEYTPHTVEEAVSLCKRLLVMFERADIPVIRVALAVTEEISPNGSVVAGPFHSAFRELVESEIYLDKMLDAVRGGATAVGVNSREVSKAVGNKRRNIEKIKELTGKTVRVYGDERIQRGNIVAS
jgi:histone acetyltransferase (RNA polymerase elongator complex component)